VLVDLSDEKEILFRRKPSPEERESAEGIEMPLVVSVKSEEAEVG